MKVEISDTREVEKVNWDKFKIFEGHSKDRLIIDGPEFRVMIEEDRIYVKYTFHRPDHDHNSRPAIKIDIPKGGARPDSDAILTVEADSGYYPDLFLDWGYGEKHDLKPVQRSGESADKVEK